MALVKRTSPSSNRLIIILVVVLILGGVAYFVIPGLISGGSSSNQSTITNHQPVITNFGQGILNDSRYKALRTFGQPFDQNANYDPGNPDPFQ